MDHLAVRFPVPESDLVLYDQGNGPSLLRTSHRVSAASVARSTADSRETSPLVLSGLPPNGAHQSGTKMGRIAGNPAQVRILPGMARL